jgi:release factor glutamine methyltransferase
MAPGAVADWLAWGARMLAAASDSPRLDAELLLAHLLGCNRAGLIVGGGDALTAQAALDYAGLIERRRLGEPSAYLTGRREFWSFGLMVSSAVLIPRPETELLVELALERLAGTAEPAVADLGTGSGAVALALAQERADARVVAVDSSAAALEVAAANARALGLERVEFREGSWCAPLGAERFDLIVSNPPYVAEGDPHLAALRFEPQQALVAGPDGLDALRAIAAAARGNLRPGGSLLLEHGAGQGGAVRTLLADAGFVGVETRRDLSGNDRATLAVAERADG